MLQQQLDELKSLMIYRRLSLAYIPFGYRNVFFLQNETDFCTESLQGIFDNAINGHFSS